MDKCTAQTLEPNIDKYFYDVKDIQQIMKISRSTAYELVNTKGFPAVRIGAAIRIPVIPFTKWIASQIEGR